MNAKGSGNIGIPKKGQKASSTKKPFNWLPVIIICIVLLILIAGGVIAWFLIFAPKSPKIIRFIADPNSIEVGQFTTLSWEIENASMAEINQIGEVESSGEIQVQPINTTEYILIGKNEKGKTETKTLTVKVEDMTLPIIGITHSPSSPNSEDKVLFTLSATDAGGISKVEIAINGQVVDSCISTPCTYEGGPYAEGSLNYEAYAYDAAGNKGSTGPRSLTIIKPVEVPAEPIEVEPVEIQPVEPIEVPPVKPVEILPEQPKDTTPPRVGVKHSPASPTITQKVTFAARATDEVGISKIEIAVNGKIEEICDSSSCTYEGGPYPEGTLNYGAYAYDKAGNRKWSGSESLIVIKPVVVPARPIEVKPVEIPPVKPIEVPPVKPVEILPVQPKDKTPPGVGVRHSPSSPNTTQKVFFTASATDAGGISKVEILVNGKIVKSCTRSPCAYEEGPYPVGNVSYEAYAYDKAGNKASTGLKSLTVNKPVLMPLKPIEVKPIKIPAIKPVEIPPEQPKDTTPPGVGVRHSPSSPNTTQKVFFTASATDAGGISKVEILVNGRIVKSCTRSPCAYEEGPYPLGNVSYEAYAYDKAGNKASTGLKSLTVSKPVLMPLKPIEVKPIEIPPAEPIEIPAIKPVEIPPEQPKDTTPPGVGIRHSPSSPNTTQKVFFTANATDAGGISKVEILVNGRIVKSCASTPCAYEEGPYPVGNVSYEAYAYDKAGNKASTGSKSLTVSRSFLLPRTPVIVQPKDTTPPRVDIKHSPSSPNTTQKVFFTASATDTGGISKVEILVNGRIVKSCTSTPCAYEGGPYPVGNVSYEAYAYDKAGNKASTGSKSLTVSRPVLMPIKRIPIRTIPLTTK
ncbi:MAG: Ig-like domain-containing protein [bacterium]